MKKIALVLALLLSLVLLFAACGNATQPQNQSGNSNQGDNTNQGENTNQGKSTAHTHTPGEWKTDKAATCTEAGSKHQVCATCGETIATEAIPATGHTGVIDAAVAPTCTETGLAAGKHCSVCGKILVAQQVIPAGHTEVIDAAVAATCTETGLTEGKHCSVCNSVIVAQEEIPATGHTPGNWVTDKEPTCDEAGNKHQVCATCGVTIANEAIPATGKHTFEDRICTVCGAKEPSKGLAFSSNGDGTCFVSGISTCADTDVVIPSVSPDGDSVTSIGEYAFQHCKSLTSVTIPDSVTSIGNYAFYDCTALTSITIPDSVTSIGNWAFDRCSSLRFNIYDNAKYLGNVNNPCVALIQTTGSYIASCEIHLDTKVIACSAFSGCKNLTSITIPDSVTNIGEYAFSGCKSLMSVIIGNSVISTIRNDVFNGCTSLISITIATDNPVYHSTGDCIIETASKALVVGCKNSEIPADGSVTRIEDGAFKDCAFESFTIPNSVTSIGNGAFRGCTTLDSIIIPNSVTSIGNEAFYGCTLLESITIPGSVTSIGNEAFLGCKYLTSVHITDIVKWCAVSFGSNGSPFAYGGNLYLNDELVTNLMIPYSVTSIGNRAFSNCKSLTSVTIPNTVTRIGSWAFSSCSKLTSITIPDSVSNIGRLAFSNCTALQYNVYDNAKYLGNANNPYVVLVKATNTSITSCDIHPNTKFIYDDAFYNCKSLTSITIPDGVTSIGEYAFSYCTSLTSVTIPNSVTSIGNWVFSNCTSLTSTTIPNSVMTIGYCVFYGCKSLQYNIYDNAKYLGNASDPYLALIEATNSAITSCNIHPDTKVIAGSAFSGCKSLISITIPDGVTSIGEYAFQYCPLTSIVVPNSVTSIGDFAFDGCTSLTSITYQGTKEQWNAISKGNNWNQNTGSYVIHCTDGDI